jgi:hypothetical protein
VRVRVCACVRACVRAFVRVCARVRVRVRAMCMYTQRAPSPLLAEGATRRASRDPGQEPRGARRSTEGRVGTPRAPHWEGNGPHSGRGRTDPRRPYIRKGRSGAHSEGRWASFSTNIQKQRKRRGEQARARIGRGEQARARIGGGRAPAAVSASWRWRSVVLIPEICAAAAAAAADADAGTAAEEHQISVVCVQCGRAVEDLEALRHEELLGGRLGRLTAAVALADEGCGWRA